MKNLQKGIIVSMLIVIIAILLIVGGVFIYTKNNSTNIVEDTNTKVSTNKENTDWKTYTNEEYGFSFQFPSYLGNVEVAASNPDNCLEMKTRPGIIPSRNATISFSNKPEIGSRGSSGRSYVEYEIFFVQTSILNTNVCGIDLQSLKNKLALDSNYESSIFDQKNSIIAYKSTISTMLGTSADRFYTLFNENNNTITVIQPRVTFFPVAYTDVSAEINYYSRGDGQDIVTFVNTNSKAEEVRKYFNDFEQLVQTFKFIK